MRGRNLTKPFTIAGFIFGELYLVYASLAPYPNGDPIPLAGKIARIAIGSIFLGPFGAALGLGIGLIVGALIRKRP